MLGNISKHWTTTLYQVLEINPGLRDKRTGSVEYQKAAPGTCSDFEKGLEEGGSGICRPSTGLPHPLNWEDLDKLLEANAEAGSE